MTKQDLSDKLQRKIQEKKNLRTKRSQLMSTDILVNVKSLMNDVGKIQRGHKGKVNPVQIAKVLKPKYKWLHDQYFMIYRATCFGEMELEMLTVMLLEKERIDREESTLEDGSQFIGDILAKKYKVNVEAMKEGILRERAQKEAEAQKMLKQ